MRGDKTSNTPPYVQTVAYTTNPAIIDIFFERETNHPSTLVLGATQPEALVFGAPPPPIIMYDNGLYAYALHTLCIHASILCNTIQTMAAHYYVCAACPVVLQRVAY